MYPRLIKLPKNRSFFLFGPRNTGKTTLLEQTFSKESTLWFDLLDEEVQNVFEANPNHLYAIVKAQSSHITHIVLDEIQKFPKLLDQVHRLIKETDKIFVLTGSSVRKLKRGGANLLGGRAHVYHLYPLCQCELGDQFSLDIALTWGSLPTIFLQPEDSDRQAFLRSYTDTYLKEEIWNEHLVRSLMPFRRFLEVAAQCNGKIVNFAKIARDVGVDDKTVKEYFCILEDTLVGFFLEPFHNSFRKRLLNTPKFYFFDPGIVRSLTRQLTIPLQESTFSYGNAFEHFLILEIQRLAHYLEPDYRLSYLQTVGNVEIDLIIERPGKNLLCIEIKSSKNLAREDISSFIRLTADIPECEAICLSCDRFMKKFDHVTCYPWKEGLDSIFTLRG